MPWNNVPKALWPKMERCVSSVMQSGKSKSNATAICYSRIVGDGVHKEASRRSRKEG